MYTVFTRVFSPFLSQGKTQMSDTDSDTDLDAQPELLTDEDIEAVNNIKKYNLDPGVRSAASRGVNYIPSTDDSQHKTAVLNHSTFRAMVEQFGRDMLFSITDLIRQICTESAVKGKEWNISTAARRLRLLSLYIESNGAIYERCSGDDLDQLEAIATVNEVFLELTEQRHTLQSERYTINAKEADLIVSIAAVKRLFRLYMKKPPSVEISQNKLIVGLNIYYTVRRNEMTSIIAKLIIHRDTPAELYASYPPNMIDNRPTAESEYNAINANYMIMMPSGHIKVVYNNYKNSHILKNSSQGDMNKRANEDRKPLRYTELKHHKELLICLAKSGKAYTYLFDINWGPHGKNSSLRIQQAFYQVCNLKLGVDVLRKMFIIANRNRFNKKATRRQLTTEMVTSFSTIDRYYDLYISPQKIVENEARMLEPLKVINRVGPRDKALKRLRVQLLIATSGILWNIPGRRPAWLDVRQSELVVRISGEDHIFKDSFSDCSVSNYDKLGGIAKKMISLGRTSLP